LSALANPFTAEAKVHLGVAKLVPDVSPLHIELKELTSDGTWDSVNGLSPIKISSGWSALRLPDLPVAIESGEISALHLSTRGVIAGQPCLALPQLPSFSIPHETRFRLFGTLGGLTILTEDGARLAITNVEARDIRADLPGLRLGSVDGDISARIEQAGTSLPFEGHSRVTDHSAEITLRAPLGGKGIVTPQSFYFDLNKPLNLGQLAGELGLSSYGVQPTGILTSLTAQSLFSDSQLRSFDVRGAIGAGRLVATAGVDVSLKAPAEFYISAHDLSKATVAASLPDVAISVDGGKITVSASTAFTARLTFGAARSFAWFTAANEAAVGLSNHFQHAGRLFGLDEVSPYPVRWNLQVEGGSHPITFSSDEFGIDLRTKLQRIDVGPTTAGGTLDLLSTASVADDHLLIQTETRGDVGAFGDRWRFDVPVIVALRRELLPGTRGELFSSKFYGGLGQSSVAFAPTRIAIGYGRALEMRSSFEQPFTSGAIGGFVQARVQWLSEAASVDSFGDINFRGLEAGAIAFPAAYLEDRLDGEAHFSAQHFLIDRLLFPQLISDASRVRQLDGIDFSLQIRSAADGAHLPGVFQAATGATLEPANALLRFLSTGLNLAIPPRALQYKRMVFDVRVEQGRINTEPVLLTLDGVRARGIGGLALDSNVRVLWDGSGQVPGPLLRDLLYTAERITER